MVTTQKVRGSNPRIPKLPLFSLRASETILVCVTDLGGDAQRSALVQQYRSHVFVALAGCQVQWCVSRRGGGIGRGSVLQQQLHDIGLPQTTGDMQRSLIILHTHTHIERYTCCFHKGTKVKHVILLSILKLKCFLLGGRAFQPAYVLICI